MSLVSGCLTISHVSVELKINAWDSVSVFINRVVVIIEYFSILSRIMGAWLLDGVHTLVTTRNYRATANLHTLQFITAPAKLFPAYVFTSRFLATASNNGDSSASRAHVRSSHTELPASSRFRNSQSCCLLQLPNANCLIAISSQLFCQLPTPETPSIIFNCRFSTNSQLVWEPRYIACRRTQQKTPFRSTILLAYSLPLNMLNHPLPSNWYLLTRLFIVTAILVTIVNDAFSDGMYSVGWKDDRWIGEDLEGNGRGFIEVLSRHFLGSTEENNENHGSGVLYWGPHEYAWTNALCWNFGGLVVMMEWCVRAETKMGWRMRCSVIAGYTAREVPLIICLFLLLPRLDMTQGAELTVCFMWHWGGVPLNYGAVVRQKQATYLLSRLMIYVTQLSMALLENTAAWSSWIHSTYTISLRSISSLEYAVA
jgi:hypothetical protein